MNLSDLRDAPDTAADLAASSLRRVSDVSLPDVSLRDISLPDVSLSDISLPDVRDIDVADLAGSAVEFAGDVAGVVATQSGRGAARVIRSVRRNPKAAIGVVAVLVLVIALIAAKRRSSESEFDSTS